MTPKNVRARRIALGMSVPELAKAFGVPVSLLHEFEGGKALLPKADTYREILDQLERQQLSERNC